MADKKISDYLPKTEILAQLAEEASELAQAALKLRRALDGKNPTPKSVEECEANLLEEAADVKVAMEAYARAAGVLLKMLGEETVQEDPAADALEAARKLLGGVDSAID